MGIIDDIFKHNNEFVAEKGYERFENVPATGQRIVVLTCMDARIDALLPSALGLDSSQAMFITNAGGVITHPFGSVVRSLLYCVHVLGVDTILVIGHTECETQYMSAEKMLDCVRASGVDQSSIDMMRYCGVDFDKWLAGVADSDDSVINTVRAVKNHPLMPKNITVCGFLVDNETGKLAQVL